MEIGTPEEDHAKSRLSELFGAQRFGVLSTCGQGQPYANLVAYAATPDLKEILFITPRETRKYLNLQEIPRAALLVDNRANAVTDFDQAVAVTAVGDVAEVPEAVRQERLGQYLRTHPNLEQFARNPGSALLTLQVQWYTLVTQFQRVTLLDARKWARDADPADR
jgi:nitroimidazol reductase NimA-like FMN-containing flavoprotein (pyridoxamine 5'-phosphate oxidase superfamily)